METNKVVFIDKEQESETYKKLFATDCEVIDISRKKPEEIYAIVFERLKGTDIKSILDEIAKIEKLIKQIEVELERAKKNINNAINRIDLKDCERWIDIRKGIEKRIEKLEDVKKELQKKIPNLTKDEKVDFSVIGEDTIIPVEFGQIIKKVTDIDSYIAENLNATNLENLINIYKSMETLIPNKNDNIKNNDAR